MKVQLESTTAIVDLVTPTGTVPARIWEGVTEAGISVFCYVTRVQVRSDADCAEFERDLQEHRAPSAEAASIPLRLVL